MGKIFLMALAISLIGCNDEYPVTYYYSPVMRVYQENGEIKIDMQKSFCARYKLIDKKNIVFDGGESLHLVECNGMFGTSTEETPIALDFIRDKLKEKKNGLQVNTED